MITIVMPSEMIATKVKLRVMLNRLLGVAKELVANVRKMHAAMSARNTQKAWREASQESHVCSFCWTGTSSSDRHVSNPECRARLAPSRRR
jgi:hypothetical protein